MQYSNLFVCLLGMGTVFFGLICLIFLTYAMGALCKKFVKVPKAIPAAASGSSDKVTPEVIAAISAAVAESLGTDINNINIRSIKKL